MGLSVQSDISLMRSRVFHGRRGQVNNAFSYDVDYLLVRVKSSVSSPARFLSFDRWNIWSIRHADHGDGKSRLTEYADTLRKHFDPETIATGEVYLLTQPRCLGYGFNPVSFWLFLDNRQQLRTVVAEVNNVGRDRHSYICAKPDGGVITGADTISVSKTLHVSPFQPVDGSYDFRFDVKDQRISVMIRYNSQSDDGLQTSMAGDLKPLTNARLVSAFIRYPLGALRVMALIHWQALKLKLKGAAFRSRPAPPSQEISS